MSKPVIKMKSMHEVVRMVMNVQKFVKAIHGPQMLPDREEMRLKLIMATTPPRRTHVESKHLPRRPKGHRVNKVAYSDTDQELHKVADSSEDSEGKLDIYQQKHRVLEEFYKKLIYDLPDAPKVSKRIEDLSKPKKSHLISVYKEHKGNFEPLRKQRIKRKVKEFQVMTTEELEQHLRDEEAKKKDKEKIRKKRKIIYHKMLNKLDQQCREMYLEKLFNRFSKYLAECAVVMENLLDVCPSNVQRLIDCIQHNIYQTCNITPEDQRINGSLYKSIAACIGWFVVEMLFIAQSVSEGDIAQTNQGISRNPQATEFDNVLQRRAMFAVKKRQSINRSKKCSFHGPPPRIHEIVKLCHLIGGR